MKEEKIGTAAEIIFHNEDNCYTIMLLETNDEQFFAVGGLPGPRKGARYRLTGEWKKHPKYGEQFAFSGFEELEPTTEDGIAAFLASGIIKGIGPATALQIVKKFGDMSLKVIADTPEKLMQINGIGPRKTQQIAESYAMHREYANVAVELAGFGLSPAACLKAYSIYGKDAPELIRENPYRLIHELSGIGFRRADEIAKKLGIPSDSVFRIKSALLYSLELRAANGDTYAPEAELAEELAGSLDITREQVRDAELELVLDGRIFKEMLGGSEVLTLAELRAAEKYCAAKLLMLCGAEPVPLPEDTESLISKAEKEQRIKLSEQQKLAARAPVKSSVSIITGGPGTGKTTIIKTIITILKNAGLRFELAAPTGRAAKRMSQATGEDAQTVHRLLEYSYSDDSDCAYFSKNEENPLDTDCIIIDELSMVDIRLMEALLSAVNPGTRLLLVGDADQLPPVGAGNVLSDMIESGAVQTVRLTEIYRQASMSMIVVNAHAINRGEEPVFNTRDSDCFFLARGSEAEISKTIEHLCTERLPKYFAEIDPYRDIQVLTPTKKGKCGSVDLNKALQQVLNPPHPSKPELKLSDRIFRTGDKVMQNKNDYGLEWKDISSGQSGSGVFNGDMGIISAVDTDSGTVSVLYDDRRLVCYDYSIIDEIEPAFALTVHKSQGSEFPVVVMPMTSFPPMLANRNLLYTAVTRAKDGVVLVGRPEIPAAMAANASARRRRSGLSFRIAQLLEAEAF